MCRALHPRPVRVARGVFRVRCPQALRAFLRRKKHGYDSVWGVGCQKLHRVKNVSYLSQVYHVTLRPALTPLAQCSSHLSLLRTTLGLGGSHAGLLLCLQGRLFHVLYVLFRLRRAGRENGCLSLITLPGGPGGIVHARTYCKTGLRV